MENADSTPSDRRAHYDLRDIFDKAYACALPYLDPEQGVGHSPMIRYAYIALREAFPQLSQQEVALLVPSLRRAFQERNKPGVH